MAQEAWRSQLCSQGMCFCEVLSARRQSLKKRYWALKLRVTRDEALAHIEAGESRSWVFLEILQIYSEAMVSKGREEIIIRNKRNNQEQPPRERSNLR